MNIVHKCNNTYQSTIKAKPADVKLSTYINSSKESNDKDPKFKVSDIVVISKYTNIFAKNYTLNSPEEVFVVKKVKKRAYVFSDLNGEEVVVTFYEQELQKANQKEFRIEKVIKKPETICQMEQIQ